MCTLNSLYEIQILRDVFIRWLRFILSILSMRFMPHIRHETFLVFTLNSLYEIPEDVEAAAQALRNQLSILSIEIPSDDPNLIENRVANSQFSL